MNDKIYRATDTISATQRTVTADGYLQVRGTLARTGIQDYLARELGLDQELGFDPNRVVRLYRPADEVFDPQSMASFEGVPITVGHPPGQTVNRENWAQVAKGDVRGIGRDQDFMTATLTIRAKDAVEAAQSGKAQLSNGYTFALDMTPGQTADGKPYDGVQKNIRGNHVALVDAARCGPACRLADSQLNPKGKPMADEAKRKVTVDGIPLEVSDTAAAAIDKLVKERGEALAAKTAAEERLKIKVGDKTLSPEEAVKQIGELQTQVAALQKDVVTPEKRDAMVADWAALLTDAKRLAPDVQTKGKTCLDIRRQVIAAVTAKDATAKAVADAVLAGKTIDAADEAVVRSTFNALAASFKPQTNDAASVAADAAVAAALIGTFAGGAPVQAADVRSLWLQNLNKVTSEEQ